jgi:hypothetical protein
MISAVKPTIPEIPVPAAASADRPYASNFKRAGFDTDGFMSIWFRRDAIPPSGVKNTGGEACDFLSAAGRFVKKKSLKTGR